MAGTSVSASAGDILALVRSGRARTRRDVQEITGLSRSTLALRMAQLINAGYVREVGQAAGSTGRPAKILSFDEARQLVLAVDLGATHANLAIVDAGGQIVAQAHAELRIDLAPDETLRNLAKRLAELLTRARRSIDEVVGVGVGIPAPVRFSTQRPNYPPMMPGWHDFPIAETLRTLLGVPVFVDNDANLMGLGESRARYPDAPSLLFVKVGTGIGAGVILHGEPERGIAGGAGDIGHIRLPGATHRCTCGAYGCLATEASGGAIARMLREGGRDVHSASEVSRLVGDGDPRAVELTERAGRLLGDVLATSVALLNPSVVVLGGAMSSHGATLLDAVRERIYERTVPLATRELFIASSSLGGDAAIQGARHLVIDQVFSADAVDSRLELVG
ncbi:ROK family protein [Agromyces mediolanus]|uniref:ROK family transcriptional regulator n=1 Tax=Agromyces mediolanus TaxID=41986 RepID=UPI00203CD2FC|nr:ROK family protein [Agromyces mediolanus]MCM3657617.1 ROK family protein [Agromyces mediolanus]